MDEIPKEWSLANILVCPLYEMGDRALACIVLQQSLNKSLSFQDSPTGGTSFVNIYKNVRLDP